MPLNAMKLIYCNVHNSQIIGIEDIDNIIKMALEVFLSVQHAAKYSLDKSSNFLSIWLGVL